jgi:hypothetical protein
LLQVKSINKYPKSLFFIIDKKGKMRKNGKENPY